MPEFDRVSKIMNSLDNNIIIKGNKNQPRTGSFEVVINEKLVFSRFNSGRFPNEKEIRSWF